MNGIFNDDPLRELSNHVFMKMLNKIIRSHQLIVDALVDGEKRPEEIVNYLKERDTEVMNTRDPYDWEV